MMKIIPIIIFNSESKTMNIKLQTFSRSLLAAALLGVFAHGGATEPAAPAQELETVNVVGTLNKIGSVPFRQAKSAVSLKAADLKAQGVDKLDELGRYQAGFTNQPYGSDSNTNWFRVRGAEAAQSFDGAPAVSYGFFTPHAETFGVEAVEVNKGADALAYGAAQSGGLINYVSKRPQIKNIGKGTVQAHAGTRQHYGIAADYTGSFGNPAYRYRLVGSYKKSGGEWRDTDNQSLYFAPSLAFDYASGSLNVLTGVQRDTGTPSSNFLPQSGTLAATDKGFIPIRNNLGDPKQDNEKNTSYWAGYEWRHDLGKGLNFSQNYRYQHTDNFHRGTYAFPSAYSPTFAPLPLNAANGYALNRGVVFNDGTAKSHSIDNRLTWRFKNDKVDNTLLGGVDYRRQNVNAHYTLFGGATPVDVFNPSASYGQVQTVHAPKTGLKFQQLGFYLQNSLKLAGKVGITAGVRHDRARSQESHSGQNVKANHTSYSGSVMYYAPHGFNPYFAYSESFRLPEGLGGNQKLYDPFTTKQIEAGVKYMPSFVDGSLSVAAFRAKDKGALVSGKDGIGSTVSGGDPIIRRGLEVQACAELGDSVDVEAAYTYLNSVTDSQDGQIRNPLFPKHSAAVRGSYRFEDGALKGLALGAGVRHIGSSVTAKGSLYSGAKVPSATLADLFARYRFGKGWEVQLNADNLTNRRHLAGCDYYCYYGQSRNVRAGVSYTF